jgi:predicted heme/steroid binding protein
MKDKILTLQKLKDMRPFKIFASGTVIDNSNGVNMSGSDKLLRWVACRGSTYDWSIYIHWAEYSNEIVHDMGDKVTDKNNIKKLVPCDNEAFEAYRY